MTDRKGGAFLGLLAIAACTPGPDPSRELDALADDVRAEANAPGAILSVLLPTGEFHVAVSGVADIESGRPLLPDDPFFLGSVSKVYTSATVLQLVEDGRVGLDDPVADFIPEVPGGDETTIRHILSHTSGLKDFYSYLYFRPDRAEMIDLVTRDWTQDEVFELIDRFGHWFDPGADWSYSNTNYWLLGVLVERLTGTRFPDAQRDLLLDPLDLARTWLTLHEPARGNLDITGYMGPVEGWEHSEMFGDLGPTTVLDRSPIEWGAGGMASSAADAVAFIAKLLGGRVLGEPQLEEMLAFHETPALGVDGGTAEGTTRPDGYGLGIVRMERPEFTVLGHGGLFTGHTAGVWYVPRCGLTVGVYFNRGFVGQRAVLDRILGALPGSFPTLAECRNRDVEGTQ